MDQKTQFEKKSLTKKSVNFSQWYTDVILQAQLADYAPVKGCMIIRPYGYAIWENIQTALDRMIKAAGVQNAYFPLFIPEKLLRREKHHVAGFSPELAVVTIGGGEKLKEKLVIRPTSETIMYEMYAKWIDSWRDLPILINQWNNVVRWEKRTYLFLRTTEFLWQEGHTVHATHEESLKEVKRALADYITLYQDYFAIAGIAGVKSEAEKFAGADATYTYEMLMPDGKALQGCTSHDLGQNFAKVFNIKFKGADGQEYLPWQTSWGLSTRSIGALVMSHGDDAGLMLPPKLAPVQAVIIPIAKEKSNAAVITASRELANDLSAKARVAVDEREDKSVGWKFNDWELKGVPLRLELGMKEVEMKTVTIVRRDNGVKISVKRNEVTAMVSQLLAEIQESMFQRSHNFIAQNTIEVSVYNDFKKAMKTTKGLLKAFWCEKPKCEMKIKEETKASTRCLPLGMKQASGKCIYCDQPAKNKWIFAQAY